MNIQNLPKYETEEELIDILSGKTSLDHVTQRNIPNVQAALKKKYKALGYFQNMKEGEKSSIQIQCLKVNAYEIIKITGIGAGIGIVGGGVVGGYIGAVPGAIFGAQIGCAGGAMVGLGVAAYSCEDIYHNKKVIKTFVEENPGYLEFKKGQTDEEFRLFRNYVNNYAHTFFPEHENDVSDLCCCLSLDIPEVPVFSPYDIKRKHPFDKSVIEAHLLQVEKQISILEGLKAKGTCNLESCDIKIEEIKQTACPFRSGYFKKEDLVYDINFAKKTINLLEKISNDMLERIEEATPEEKIKIDRDDKLLYFGVSNLLNHQLKVQNSAIKSVVENLQRDIIYIGGSWETAIETGNSFKKMVLKV
jgi:hypothetical protein